MKKILKVVFTIILVLIIAFIGFILYLNFVTSNINLDKDNLINMERTITYYDQNMNTILEESNGMSITDIENIPTHTQNAFVAIEDKRFYSHHGVDYKGLARATINNIKSFSLKEGASTISQQLIKNTHLTNEKTFKRKITEIKLAKELEKQYTKSEILEKYLNTIYFGDGCYGITSAAKYYFSKNTEDLTLNESAVLAAIIKAPSYYSPFKNYEKCEKRKNTVLKEMFDQGYISSEEYETTKTQSIKLNQTTEESNKFDFLYLTKKQLNEYISATPYASYHLNVITTCDIKLQSLIEEKINNHELQCDKSIVIIDKNGDIKAYYSTCGDINRQMGSVIKPLLVYGPAIENNIVDTFSKIKDEKTDFNGYSPSNYNDKYYGEVTVKESLSKSLNVSAVKLLNYTGIDRSLAYLNKMNIKTSQNDRSLCLALGASEFGAKLTDLTSAYTVFMNGGNHIKSTTISQIKNKNQNIFTRNKNLTKVFNNDTVDILNDMLRSTVTDGTAKKLSYTNFVTYGKTGTVGNENGNTDAYVISYDKNYTVGCWFGNTDNTLMENSVSGGTFPSILECEIWKSMYDGSSSMHEIENSNGVSNILIDKISYDKDGSVILADENSPIRYTENVLIKNSRIPTKRSTRFSSPEIEKPKITINNMVISIELCLTEYYNAYIYRQANGEKKLVHDTYLNNKKNFDDYNLEPSTVYEYSIVPYFKNDNEIFLGNEIFLEKIKSPTSNVDDWWIDDLE